MSFDSNILLFKVRQADVITKQLMLIGERDSDRDIYYDISYIASLLADKWDQEYLEELDKIENETAQRSFEKYPFSESPDEDPKIEGKRLDWAAKQKTLRLTEASIRLMARSGMLPTKAELQASAGKKVSEVDTGKPAYPDRMPAK